MIRTWKKIGAGMILCIFMAGCGSQNEVYLETEVSQDTGNVQETEETEAGERLDILDVFRRRADGKCGSAGGFR